MSYWGIKLLELRQKIKFNQWWNNNRLLYDGEYLNGKRHGNGKEYYYINNSLNNFEKGVV